MDFDHRDHFKLNELRKTFSGREAEVRLFGLFLHDLAPPPVLMFHGPGGVGKTYLMRYLLYEFIRGWESKRGQYRYPHAFVSFHVGDSSSETAEGLIEIYQELKSSSTSIEFPRFMWATSWKHSIDSQAHTSRALIPQEFITAAELLSAAGIVTGVDIVTGVEISLKTVNVLDAAFKRLRKQLAFRKFESWLRKRIAKPTDLPWEIMMIHYLEQAEVNELLPLALAADLAECASSSKNKRPVIFVDNYEYLRSVIDSSALGEANDFVAVFAAELQRLEANTLVVIAGRRCLRWGEEYGGREWQPNVSSLWSQDGAYDEEGVFQSKRLVQRRIGNFVKIDAIQFLSNHNLSPELATMVLDYTQGYPLALSLLADLHSRLGPSELQLSLEAIQLDLSRDDLATENRLERLTGRLVKRLLDEFMEKRPDLKSLLLASVIPRWFEFDLLSSITGHSYDFPQQFHVLTQFSFVEPYSTENIQAYRIHALVRRWIREEQEFVRPLYLQTQVQKLHEKSRKWFQQQADSSTGPEKWIYEIEALYHTWFLKPQEALQRFLDLFGELWLRRELLDIVNEIFPRLSSDFRARLKYCEALFYRESNDITSKGGWRNELSLRAVEEAIVLSDSISDQALRAEIYIFAGEAYTHAATGALSRAKERFRRALQMYRKAYEISSQFPDVQARTLSRRACLETEVNPEYGSLSLMSQAIELARSSNDLRLQRNLLKDQVSLALHLESYDVAEQSLHQAERVHAVRQDESRVDDEWDAVVSQLWGEYYALRSKWVEAVPYFRKVMAILAVWPNAGYVSACAAKGWLGLCLCHLGDIQQGLTLVKEALTIEAELLGSQEGVAKWLHHLGELFAEQDEQERALHCWILARRLREEQGHSELRKTETALTTLESSDPDWFRKRILRLHPRMSEFGRYAFLWGIGPVRSLRQVQFSSGPSAWEERGISSPTAWMDGNQVYLLYAAGSQGTVGSAGLPVYRIGLASSTDGIHFERLAVPVITPQSGEESCEDPRLSRIDDMYYMTYSVYMTESREPRLALAKSKDLQNWVLMGYPFQSLKMPEESSQSVQQAAGTTRCGMILPDKLYGYYWMLFGDKHVWLAYSSNLQAWHVRTEPVLSPRPDRFDSRRLEVGVVLREANGDIWLGYNAICDSSEHWTFGQALFDQEKPHELLRRSPSPFFQTEESSHLVRQVPSFSGITGAVEFDKKLFLYYGTTKGTVGVIITERWIRN